MPPTNDGHVKLSGHCLTAMLVTGFGMVYLLWGAALPAQRAGVVVRPRVMSHARLQPVPSRAATLALKMGRQAARCKPNP